MSRAGRKNIARFGMRLELRIIKIRVCLIMLFFKRAIIERADVDYELHEKLKTWALKRKINFSVKEERRKIYIKSQHYQHQSQQATRTYKILLFSK